jgi:hypothetical protein
MVEFRHGGLRFLAEFLHQHAEEHPTEKVHLPVWDEVPIDGGVLGSQKTEKFWVRDDLDGKILKPIIETVDVDGQKIERKLRHITTCKLLAGEEIGWTQVGEGVSRCSVKDKYRWRFGVKESLKAAIKAAGFAKVEGPMLGAFYEELRKRA